MTAPSSTTSTRERRPLFSIGIPTFNRAHWLKACVNSALSQTFSSFEVVVSDNASTDHTLSVLKQFSDERLIVLSQPRNVGPIANWNACLAAARGSYIVILSDDDNMGPHLLERCRMFIEGHSDIPLVVALADVYEPETGISRPAATSRVLPTGVHNGFEILLEWLRGRLSPATCTVAINAEMLRSRGGFPEGWPHTGDLVSWVPLLLHGRAGFVNESCGTYCSHEGTQTAKFSLETRLKDLDRLACAIVEEARLKVSDRRLLNQIERLAQQYIARNCIGHMGSERKKGGSRREIAAVAWNWRHRLAASAISDVGTFLRPVALFVLPLPVTRLIGRVKHLVLRAIGAIPDRHRSSGAHAFVHVEKK